MTKNCKYWAIILDENLVFDSIIYGDYAHTIQEEISKIKSEDREIFVAGIFYGREVDFEETIVVHPV